MALVPMHQAYRLICVEVDPTLSCAEWPEGARLVADLDAQTPAWQTLTLLHAEGRCRVGHVLPLEAGVVFASKVDGEPRVLLGAWRILGTMVAAVTAL